ncbi:MAG: PQQ-dependent sugar dehydrogenase [Chloroflexi bacterium]|nr:MAG: PQQ-dependent sugar dehydrogenase [Chloroflexota bacterium]
MGPVGGRGLAVGLAFAFLASACAPGGGITGRSSPPSGPLFTDTVIQSGLIVPWEVAVAADGRMFVTERPGTISVFESTAPMAKRVASAQVSGVRAMGEAGLLGLALDPDFSRNQLFYVCASRIDAGEWRNEVLRYRLAADGPTVDTTILRTGIVASGLHDACRMRFGPDGKLWIVTGDGGQSARAQDAASFNGKVLRINTDGSVPSDNPIFKGQTAASAVYALGLRNPGGLAFQPTTGTCFVVDAGDQAQDKIDEVSAGANFGWPVVLGAPGSSRGFADPAWTSGTATFAVAGADFLSGPAWGSWSGSLVVATLKEQDLRRFSMEETHATQREILLDQKYGRLRAVTLAPDGSLLVTTSGGSGDRIVKITPTR